MVEAMDGTTPLPGSAWTRETRKTCIMENATPNVSRPLNLRLSSGSYLHGSAFRHTHTHTEGRNPPERLEPDFIAGRSNFVLVSHSIWRSLVLSVYVCVEQRHVGRPWATEGRL